MTQPFFDKSDEYDAMLAEGLKLSGEDKSYFMRGRIQDLKSQLPVSFLPRRILDFGCGIGETTRYLAEVFPEAEVVGVDSSIPALNHAKEHFSSPRVSFLNLDDFQKTGLFDVCYTNGVFHHIPPQERLRAAKIIFSTLRPRGYFALFENNPWNFGARLVMKRISFDRDAIPLDYREVQNLLAHAGFGIFKKPRFLFYFPRVLSVLRFLEPLFVHLPLGAQFYIVGIKENDV